MIDDSNVSGAEGETEQRFRILPGLPPYGSPAIPIPETWGRTGREGLVVEFQPGTLAKWVANFRPGYFPAVQRVLAHPNDRDVVVVAGGDVWIVDPKSHSAQRIEGAVDGVWELKRPPGIVFSRQGLAFLRLGHEGIVWHTRRLSWDGFDEVCIEGDELRGLAWSPVEDRSFPFTVDLRTGTSRGGSFSDTDHEGWERLNEAPDEF
jgi:hypothetical protein